MALVVGGIYVGAGSQQDLGCGFVLAAGREMERRPTALEFGVGIAFVGEQELELPLLAAFDGFGEDRQPILGDGVGAGAIVAEGLDNLRVVEHQRMVEGHLALGGDVGVGAMIDQPFDGLGVVSISRRNNGVWPSASRG